MTEPQWTPNENQEAALDWAQDNNYLKNVKKMCDSIGISRQAYYQWWGCEDFCTWWSKKRRQHFGSRLDEVHAMICARATGQSKKGSHADAKLFLEAHDAEYAPRSRQEVTGAGGEPLKTYVQVDIAGVVEGKKPEDSNGDGKTSMD